MSNKFQKIIDSNEFREEFFVAETQSKLSEMLEEKGVSRAELARKLDVSRARVTQIFSDDAKNLTLRLLARSFLALDEEPVILTKSHYDQLQRRARKSQKSAESSNNRDRDNLPTQLIAELFRSIEKKSVDQEKPTRRIDSTKEWSESHNVVPLRRSANG